MSGVNYSSTYGRTNIVKMTKRSLIIINNYHSSSSTALSRQLVDRLRWHKVSAFPINVVPRVVDHHICVTINRGFICLNNTNITRAWIVEEIGKYTMFISKSTCSQICRSPSTRAHARTHTPKNLSHCRSERE